MSDPAELVLTREELASLNENFRELKHSVNNTLAVIMALSELGQRNPAHLEKLAAAVLHRGPNVVQQLQDFQVQLGAKLKTGNSEDESDRGIGGSEFPTSGVF